MLHEENVLYANCCLSIGSCSIANCYNCLLVKLSKTLETQGKMKLVDNYHKLTSHFLCEADKHGQFH